MVSQRVLNALKVATAKFLTETCTIEQLANARDRYGNKIPNQWETVASGVACRVITTGGQGINRTSSMDVGSQEAMVETYRLIVPAGTSLDVDYRVTVNSVIYQVVSVLVARTDETDRQAILTRVRE